MNEEKVSGRKLDFISQICRDGNGTAPIARGYLSILRKQKFRISCLSLTQETYIASGFNSFVVRLKKPIKFP